MDAVTLQPAAGAHGELTGILLIRALLETRGNPRKKILIPDSAHGTNPATAAMAGYAVENIRSNERGMVDLEQLWRGRRRRRRRLMVTNPNTLGVFEENIRKVAEILHAKGALVYMDGANMNALVGIARPGDFGVDVMHLNLHKTFSTPHGGGGPGAGPVAVKKHLEPFLPVPRLKRDGRQLDLGLRPAAVDRPGAGLLRQLRRAGARAGLHPGARRRRACATPPWMRVLNANYIRKRAGAVLTICLQRAHHARVRVQRRPPGRKGVRTGDIAKRLIDYGFHPYTVSFPLIVHGALMIEPTETESKHELDLFSDAMIAIAKESENRSGAGARRAAPDAHQPRRRSDGGAQADRPMEARASTASLAAD